MDFDRDSTIGGALELPSKLDMIQRTKIVVAIRNWHVPRVDQCDRTTAA